MTKILVPTDGSSSAVETADYAMQIAKAIEADVLVLQVILRGGPRETDAVSMKCFTDAGKEHNVSVQCAFREGAIIHQIVEFAEKNDVDLIVMGASKGRIVDQWVSSDVRENTTIPVLVIPYQIFD